MGGPIIDLSVCFRAPYFVVQASKTSMDNNAIFDERYRVIAIDEQNLILRGVRSGEVLTIKNADPENPLTAADYPPGKLIALNDPSTDIKS
jgi:hypothetical protein